MGFPSDASYSTTSVAEKSNLSMPSRLGSMISVRTEDASVSGSGVSGSGTPVGRPLHVDPVVAKKEQKVVAVARLVMVAVILIVMIALACTMYLLISTAERNEFETQFGNYASEMSSVARQNAVTMVDTVYAFSLTVTSFAHGSNQTWPFVTLEDWSLRAEMLYKLTKPKTITMAPIVQPGEREAWLNYSRAMLPKYYQQAIEVEGFNTTVEDMMAVTEPHIFRHNPKTYKREREDRDIESLVLWQYFPLFDRGMRMPTNFQMNQYLTTVEAASSTGGATMTFLPYPVYDENFQMTDQIHIMSELLQPIFKDTGSTGRRLGNVEREVVGMIVVVFDFIKYFENLLPDDVKGIILVLESSCGDNTVFSYKVDGGSAVNLGPGDLHDPKYDDLVIESPFVNIDHDSDTIPEGTCIPALNLRAYPSQAFEESYYTNTAFHYTVGVVAIFFFTSLVFGIYDFSVRRRQSKVMARIIYQDKIVSNIFPTAIRDKLYKSNNKKRRTNEGLDDFGDIENPDIFGNEGPLAELYPCVSVVFADIAGFTAWSSAREPAQVFELLENLYGAFDQIAYHHGVFKVETVGDCYVAVGGLPEAKEDHALIVAKFARGCLHKMKELTNKLEVVLGPDTADLELRLGIHTGQVTAGVLRGERSRFQLFGDTVNTASRMEATSIRSRIQISSATAEELRRLGYDNWIRPRKGTVAVKGKGNMQTFWLESKMESYRKAKKNSMKKSMSAKNREEMAVLLEEDGSEGESYSDEDEQKTMSKMERLVGWNVEVLGHLLQQILAKRNSNKRISNRGEKLNRVEASFKTNAHHDGSGRQATVLDEFKEIISLPTVDDEELQQWKNSTLQDLDHVVVSELRQFLSAVASLYRSNPFHNFEHASHVTSSVRKLLTRIVNANNAQPNNKDGNKVQLVDRAGHSFGITSDPLTQFAVVFSAIIHDADHPGVPNTQLVKEATDQAKRYRKSIAEQNSVDLVWDLLMRPEYSNLRACIYCNGEELRRFRQLVVNTVMATDIVDKELQALRKARWETAFSTTMTTPIDSVDIEDKNRKATIVIEHLIQASDVSHTMQHWHIYKRWNERFFMECYGAYKAGRADSDPSIGWYKGEIGFFDFYVIPLAKKLDSCGVFGVSSDEYLNYAVSNREEWVREGERMVQEYLRRFDELDMSDGETDSLSDSVASQSSYRSEYSL